MHGATQDMARGGCLDTGGHPTASANYVIVQRRQRLGGMLNFYYRKAA